MNRPIVIKITLKGQEIDTLVLDRHCVLIGCEPGADILLDGPGVSLQHASIELGPGTIRIRDLLSASGTLVNGESISWVDLKDGDVIRIGRFELHVALPRTADAHRLRGRAAPQAALEAPNPPAALPRKNHEERSPASHHESAWEDSAVIDLPSWQTRPSASRMRE